MLLASERSIEKCEGGQNTEVISVTTAPGNYRIKNMQNHKYAHGLLTTAIVLVFLYFGIDKFVHPVLWMGWIPLWMDGLLTIPVDIWLMIIGAFEILLALFLLFPIRKVRQIGCILIALHLVAILTQVGWNDIGVRDTGLLLAALLTLVLQSIGLT